MHSQCVQRSSQREYHSNFKVTKWFTEEWSLTTHYSERLQSALFNMKRPESEEELTDKAANINNKWMTALSALTVELSHIKILVSMQHYRFNARQLRHYLTTNQLQNTTMTLQL